MADIFLSYNREDHRVGAALDAELSDTMRFGAGHYAPLSNSAPDHTFKVSFEYAFDIGRLS